MKKFVGLVCITVCCLCFMKHWRTDNVMGITSGLMGYLGGLVMLFGEE